MTSKVKTLCQKFAPIPVDSSSTLSMRRGKTNLLQRVVHRNCAQKQSFRHPLSCHNYENKPR